MNFLAEVHSKGRCALWALPGLSGKILLKVNQRPMHQGMSKNVVLINYLSFSISAKLKLSRLTDSSSILIPPENKMDKFFNPRYLIHTLIWIFVYYNLLSDLISTVLKWHAIDLTRLEFDSKLYILPACDIRQFPYLL